jgi:outer membrane protein assembly factor BamD
VRPPPTRYLWILAALAGLPACGGGATESRGALHYAEDAKRAYDKAMVAFEEHDWEEAKALFKEVKKKYGYSRYARLAELRMADTDFASEKLAEAIQGYRSFVHDHRTDSEIPYARFRICKGLFDQISEGGFLLPPLEERDQGTSAEAYKELSSFVHDFPVGPYATQAKYMLEVITGRLVRHELYVARFYLRRDDYEAAVARTQYALHNYDGSGLEPEAMVLLGETYLKMHKPAEARSVFKLMLAKYPASAFTTAANNFLLEMDKQGK